MSDWWSRKLSGQPTQAPTRPAPPSTGYLPPVQPPTPQPAAPTKTTYTDKQSTCPGCGSDNYFSMGRTAVTRCYDCGYPVEQGSSGLQGDSTGPVKAARQVPSTGYQPQNIAAGRVG